jgi:hypothetical protein
MATRRGGGRKVTPESAAKRARAAALRAEGFGWQDTADGAGYGSIGAVRSAVARYHKDNPDENPAELRRVMLGELDQMETVLDKLEQGKYVKVTPAGIPAQWVETDPETGETTVRQVIDVGPILDMIKLRVVIQKRRSDLIGADAPRRTAADVTITAPELPAHLRKLVDPDAGG